MRACNVDVLISAPQKGWSASACCAMVMLGEEARRRIDFTQSTSFACDLRAWLGIMEAYEKDGHAYHATLPTDALVVLHHAIIKTAARGHDKLRVEQQRLGDTVRRLLREHGFKSVAATGFEAPSVVVSYTSDDAIKSGGKFAEVGVQVAAGVHLACDEPEDFKTFRLGLFGLDKLGNVERTVASLAEALDKV
jgi:aspartate aminotransferase-like enzyme